MTWTIARGPQRYVRLDDGIDVGWMWILEGADGEHPISVEVPTGRLSFRRYLVEDSAAAIYSQGRTAIASYLEDAEPPTRIKITSGGLLSYYAN